LPLDIIHKAVQFKDYEMGWYVACMGQIRNAYTVLVVKREGIPGRRWV